MNSVFWICCTQAAKVFSPQSTVVSLLMHVICSSLYWFLHQNSIFSHPHFTFIMSSWVNASRTLLKNMNHNLIVIHKVSNRLKMTPKWIFRIYYSPRSTILMSLYLFAPKWIGSIQVWWRWVICFAYCTSLAKLQTQKMTSFVLHLIPPAMERR